MNDLTLTDRLSLLRPPRYNMKMLSIVTKAKTCVAVITETACTICRQSRVLIRAQSVKATRHCKSRTFGLDTPVKPATPSIIASIVLPSAFDGSRKMDYKITRKRFANYLLVRGFAISGKDEKTGGGEGEEEQDEPAMGCILANAPSQPCHDYFPAAGRGHGRLDGVR